MGEQYRAFQKHLQSKLHESVTIKLHFGTITTPKRLWKLFKKGTMQSHAEKARKVAWRFRILYMVDEHPTFWNTRKYIARVWLWKKIERERTPRIGSSGACWMFSNTERAAIVGHASSLPLSSETTADSRRWPAKVATRLSDALLAISSRFSVLPVEPRKSFSRCTYSKQANNSAWLKDMWGENLCLKIDETVRKEDLYKVAVLQNSKSGTRQSWCPETTWTICNCNF